MKNKKIILSIVIVTILFALFLLFMYRVEIYNKIFYDKTKKTLKALERRTYEISMVKNNESNIRMNEGINIYGNLAIYCKKKEALLPTFSDKSGGRIVSYKRMKVSNVDQNELNTLSKYTTKEYKVITEDELDVDKVQNGDIIITLYKYKNTSDLIPNELKYIIKKDKATELHEIYNKHK